MAKAGEFDFLMGSGGKTPAGRAKTTGPRQPARKPPQASSASPSAAGGQEKPPVIEVNSGTAAATLAIDRELTKIGADPIHTDTEEVTLQKIGEIAAGVLPGQDVQQMQARQAARSEAELKIEDAKKRVAEMNELIGKQFRADLLIAPPMWAAQELSAGFNNKRDKVALEICHIELTRLVRVLEAAGMMIVSADE